MPALLLAIVGFAGLAVIIGLLIARCIESARWQREIEARDAARHARAGRG